MRHDFKFVIFSFTFLVLLFLNACVTQERKPPPQISQLQIRELQTRTFTGETAIAGMKSVSAALQDEGYSIESANTELGLITANRTVNDIDTENRNTQIFWLGFAKDYRAARSWKVTANVVTLDDKLRIRISLVEQELNETGGIIYSQPVVDPAPYQALFSKIDKSVFLQKNKL